MDGAGAGATVVDGVDVVVELVVVELVVVELVVAGGKEVDARGTATVVGGTAVVVGSAGGATTGAGSAGPAVEPVAKRTPAAARMAATRAERARRNVVCVMPGWTHAGGGSFRRSTEI
jgi:hypothetical protein